MNEDARHPVKPLETIVEIIEMLTELHSAPLREIAAGLDMNKSTTTTSVLSRNTSTWSRAGTRSG